MCEGDSSKGRRVKKESKDALDRGYLFIDVSVLLDLNQRLL